MAFRRLDALLLDDRVSTVQIEGRAYAPTGRTFGLERLTLVHVIDFISGVEPYESTIEVDFHRSGDQARMVVTLHPHRDPHWTKMSVRGFGSQLTKLDRRCDGTGR